MVRSYPEAVFRHVVISLFSTVVGVSEATAVGPVLLPAKCGPKPWPVDVLGRLRLGRAVAPSWVPEVCRLRMLVCAPLALFLWLSPPPATVDRAAIVAGSAAPDFSFLER